VPEPKVPPDSLIRRWYHGIATETIVIKYHDGILWEVDDCSRIAVL